MILDGVSDSLQNSEYHVTLDTFVNLVKNTDSEEEIVKSLRLQSGYGMCIGYRGWLEDDFNNNPIVKKS